MYGSYVIPCATGGSQWKALLDDLGQSEENSRIRLFQTGQIDPGMLAPVFALTDGSISASLMYWGFPRWEEEPPISIARAESAPQQSLFGKAFRERRVAVPTDGFYEWWDEAADSSERHLFFSDRDEILYMAGFYTVFREEDELRPCFCVLTTEANENVQPFHDRMPVLLHPQERDAWILGTNLQEVMMRPPFAVQVAPIQVHAMLM